MKEPAAKKEAMEAVKKDTVQARCRRAPVAAAARVSHAECASNRTSPLSTTLRSKAPGSWR